MQSVKDNEGRPWTISITAATGFRIRDTVRLHSHRPSEKATDGQGENRDGQPFDVLDITQIASTLNVLRGMPLILAETAWAIIQPQAAAKGVSRESFLEALSGDALDAMGKAIIDEAISFFPASQRRMVVVLREKLDEVSDAIIGAAERELATIETADVVTAASATPGDREVSEVTT
jgi:hypothetical protein